MIDYLYSIKDNEEYLSTTYVFFKVLRIQSGQSDEFAINLVLLVDNFTKFVWHNLKNFAKNYKS